MSKNRIKSTGPVIKSRAQLDEAMSEIRELTLSRNAHALELERRKKLADEQCGPAIELANVAIDRLTESVRAWAEANPAEFGKFKSLDTTHGTLGFRTGTPKLKTIAGWTWDRVLEGLRALKRTAFIRTKEEVNKDAIIEARDRLLDGGLRVMGIRVVQEETFFIEPKIEATENRVVTTAG